MGSRKRDREQTQTALNMSHVSTKKRDKDPVKKVLNSFYELTTTSAATIKNANCLAQSLILCQRARHVS